MLISTALQAGRLQQHFHQNYVRLPMGATAQGKTLFIAKERLAKFQKDFASKDSHFGLQYLYRHILTLKGDGICRSLMHTSSPFSKVLTLPGGEIRYAAFEGNIYIDDINITGPLGVDAKHPAGLYKVVKRGSGPRDWEAKVKEDETIEQTGDVITKHLAINGYSNSLNDAAAHMPQFIEYGHGQSSLSKNYTLFFNPPSGAISGAYHSLADDIGLKDRESAKKLAIALEGLSKKNQDICLTVNGSGHSLLKSALKRVSSTNIKLPRVTVFYANATTNLEKVDQLRRKLDMQIVEKPPLINPGSLQQNIVAGNLLSGPVVAMRAQPKNSVSIFFDAASSIPVSIGASLATTALFGSLRSLEKEVIQTPGDAIQKGGKLVWNSIHKTMVKS